MVRTGALQQNGVIARATRHFSPRFRRSRRPPRGSITGRGDLPLALRNQQISDFPLGNKSLISPTAASIC